MRKLGILVAVLLLLCAATPALADNLFPPPYVGAPLSYHAEWDTFLLGTFATGIAPDFESSVDDTDPNTFLYNAFSTHIDFDGSAGWASHPDAGGGAFHNPLEDATFRASVVNWVDWEEFKLLRVQVTYTDALANGSPTITEVTGVEEAAPNGSLPLLALDVLTLGGPLGRVDPDPNHFYEDFIIIPNPDWEFIDFFLPQGTIVEQIVIDTVSMPEPASLGLLGVALLGLRKRRR